MKQAEVEKKYQAYDRWSAGKGSAVRPYDRRKYAKNWERIFGKRK